MESNKEYTVTSFMIGPCDTGHVFMGGRGNQFDGHQDKRKAK